MFTRESYITDKAQPIEIKKMEPNEGLQPRNGQKNLRAHTPPDIQLEDKERKINAGLKSYFKFFKNIKRLTM